MKAKFAIILVSVLSYTCFAEHVRTRIVAGRVIDYRARPVEGAFVVCYDLEPGIDQYNIWDRWKANVDEPLGRMSTGSDGQFSFRVAATKDFSPRVVAGKEGLALGWCHYTHSSELIPTIRLGKPRLLKGTVVDETGRPVSGATVRICIRNRMMAEYTYIAPIDPKSWFVTHTDMDGQFVFNNIPKGATADFMVKAPGKATISTFSDLGLDVGEQFHAGQTDIRIKLPVEARLSDTVVNESTGQALAGVGILAHHCNSAGWRIHHCPDPVQTDDNGRFELAGLAPATYQLETVFDQARSACLTMTLEAGQIMRNVKVSLSKGIPFEVVVCDVEEENPIENADVTVTKKPAESRYDTFSQTVTTDANGLARLKVPPGECDVKVHKFGYGAIFEPQRVQIDFGKVLQYEIFLPRTLRILSGEVLDEQGRPLPDALVIQMTFGPRTLTDAEGRFDTSHIGYHITSGRRSSRERVLVRHVPSGLGAFGILEDPNKSGRPKGQIILKPAHTLTGRVIDPDGKSIPAAYVRLLQARYRTLITEVLTDANGEYSIPSVPNPGDNPKDSFAITAFAESFGTAQIVSIPWHDNTDEPVRLNPIILLPADQAISGIVLDSNDQPIAGALVRVRGPRFSSRYSPPLRGKTLTDAQGRFRIAGLCEEPLEIYTRSPSKQQQTGTAWAHGGYENVRIIMGQKLQFTPSLIGKPLPELKDLGINLSPANANDKVILVCFFDMNQRPSRNCIIQLTKQAEQLKNKGVTVAAIQSSKVDKNELSEWVKNNNIPFSTEIIEDDSEKIRFAWGVKSLPWLILTDREHIVRAEGFALAELDEKLKANK